MTRISGIDVMPGLDKVDAARVQLGRTRITLHGTRAAKSYSQIHVIRREALAAARLLRQGAAAGAYFPDEMRAAANQAVRAAKLVSRVMVALNKVDGEPGGPSWERLERRILRVLDSAIHAIDSAYALAYTGTHY